MHLELVCPLFSTAKPSKIRSFPTKTGIIKASKFPTNPHKPGPKLPRGEPLKTKRDPGKPPPPRKKMASNQHQTKPKKKASNNHNKTKQVDFNSGFPYLIPRLADSAKKQE